MAMEFNGKSLGITPVAENERVSLGTFDLRGVDRITLVSSLRMYDKSPRRVCRRIRYNKFLYCRGGEISIGIKVIEYICLIPPELLKELRSMLLEKELCNKG